jgi:hypothetical protein
MALLPESYGKKRVLREKECPENKGVNMIKPDPGKNSRIVVDIA